jgi:two-component system, chemotaxis family, protein-glutamate methylesterase/glutaminase
MPSRDVVVIGASAGGLEALSVIMGALPGSLPACILVVVHSSPHSGSLLPDILQRVSALPVAYAREGDALRHGRVYLARPDQHLLIKARKLTLGQGPRENGFRPAIDPLFRTAARELGPRVIGVVLSGGLGDGTYGLSAIKKAGGVAIVQDPQEAIVGSMPLSAMSQVGVDHVAPAGDIAGIIERLARAGLRRGGSPMSGRRQQADPQLASGLTDVADMNAQFGPPSGLTCPDCGGALWEVEDGRVVRYQCHVGHQYAPESLEAGQRDAIDGVLWAAVRVLEEHADLKARMARRAADRGLETVAAGFVQGAEGARTQAERLRSIMMQPARPPATRRGRKRRES